MKRLASLWLGVAAVAAVLVPLDMAAGAGPGTVISCLKFNTRTTPVSTTSTAWTNVPGMTVAATLAQNFLVQVSGTFSGAGFRTRMRDTSIGGTFTLDQGATSVHPRSGIVEPFSFTWVGTNPAEHVHTFHLQWSRLTPGTSTMKAGQIALTYQGAPTPSNC
jgi:hypothetical protein